MAVIVWPPDRIFAGYAFDLDGTVYLGDRLIPGADKAIELLRAAGCRVVFVTNKPLETAAAYAAKLTRLGIPTEPADVVTALDTLVRYLDRYHRGARLLLVAEPLVASILIDAGFLVTTQPEHTDVVVVSFDRTFDYAKLLAAYRAVNAGATIVATNPDRFCPTPDGGLPDCAAMLAAIEACTGAHAEAVLGKPSTYMAEAVLARLGVPAADAAVVGDRLATDVALGQSLGMAGILTLTGDPTSTPGPHQPIQPDYVVDGLLDLIPHAARRPS
ncbi:MAG TPA: HAD-IIA family hydrolase [Pseudonocardiaceae bacterium]|jgi:NagD protein|nr:HAD-IIA family hydrolase [Pseudonocardiaceae bacterium]